VRILALFSIKGGVGKTAAAVNLAYIAARTWQRTLVWDLDPQSATTFYFRAEPRLRGGIEKLLRPKRAADRFIRGTRYENLDLLPADLSCRNLDLILDDLKKPTKGLRRALKPLRSDYDLVFLDCPPSLSLLSENVFRAAEALIVPLIPTPLSLRTYQQLVDFCRDENIEHLQLLPFFSMVDRRRKLHCELVDEFSKQHPDALRAEIPYASVVEQMSVHQAPLATYARWTDAAESYERLWREIRERLQPAAQAPAEAG
jgi:chromosome partitioning protein